MDGKGVGLHCNQYGLVNDLQQAKEGQNLCGLTGYMSNGTGRALEKASLRAMVDALAHRGPDEYGEWFSEDGVLAIGHRRLSIQDLSPAGRQPMASASGRFVVAFNGEIYNFRSLRRDLEQSGAAFSGHSDTEVMLAAFEAWGVEESLSRFAGMFAFALYDQQEQRLFLARDRMGEKPLFKQRLAFTCAVCGADSLSEYYRQRVSYWPFPEQLLSSASEAPYGLTAPLPDGTCSGIPENADVA